MPYISVTLLVFHLEISGNDINDEQSANHKVIKIILLVFHLDISGHDFNELQL